MYPIRRALLLRALLEKREPQLRVGERIIIDDAVLNGLLSIPRYHHGARSLEMILAMSTVSGRREFERAALPAESQLNLHVDAKEFMNLVRYPRLSEKLRETIARELDTRYKEQRQKMVLDGEERRKLLEQDPAMWDWNDMEEQDKESTRSQADDIPHKLRMVNCYMAKESRGARVPVEKFTDAELDILAEREHERWNAERLQKQWRLGSQEEAERKQSYLIPWRDLHQDWKDVNRALVDCIPQVLALASVGYKIYRLGTGGR
jgi:RyR domain